MTTVDDRRTEAPFAPRPRRRRGRAFVVVLLVLALPCAALAGGWAWYRHEVGWKTPNGNAEVLTVRSGWGVSQIADALATAKVVDSAFAFRLYVRQSGHDRFEAGRYALRSGMGIEAAVHALDAGPMHDQQTLTVLPGRWLPEVATEVGRQLDIDPTAFLDVVLSGRVHSKYQPTGSRSLEGLLAPDTYAFLPHTAAVAVVTRLVHRFDEIADSIDLAGGAAKIGRTPYDVIRVASLIQSEIRVATDGPLVASVVYNRLDRGMPLQIDATVLYAIGHRKASNTAADRAVDSPYNTYRVRGLPPTPIATVTKASLLAALHPASTTYLYYVLAATDGHHAFASTYAEHLRNVEAARRAGLLK